jgi:hypothetical protein
MGLFDSADARILALEARVAALEGTPVEPPVEPEPAPTPQPSEPPAVPAGATQLTAGASLRSNRVYTGNVRGSGDYGAYCEGIADTKVIRAEITGFQFAMALWGGERLAVLGLTGRSSRPTLYGAALKDCELSWLDLEAAISHGLYLTSDCADITGHDWRLVCGKQGTYQPYALHLYCEGGSASGLTAERLYLDGRLGVCAAVFENWSDVHLKDVESYAVNAHYDLWNCSDIIVEDFVAYGGTALVSQRSGTTSQNVLFRNGVYHGPRLTPDGQPIPGVTFDNVRLV